MKLPSHVKSFQSNFHKFRVFPVVTLSHPVEQSDLLAALLEEATAVELSAVLHADSLDIRPGLPHHHHGTLDTKLILRQREFGDRAFAAKSLKGQPFHY